MAGGKPLRAWWALLMWVGAATCRPAAELDRAALPVFELVFKRCSPSVVNISARRSLPRQALQLPPRQLSLLRAAIESLGSGFVFERPGRILTCASVIEGAEEISVILANGRRLAAQPAAIYTGMDLALLEIDPALSPPPLAGGDSSSLRPGQWAASFGYPYGLSHSLTAGMIAGILPSGKTGSDHRLIIFDGAVNPGSNGGPMIDSSGRVIGVNLVTEGYSPFGQALAIDDVRRILSEPRTENGWLGLSVRATSQDERPRSGLSAAARVSRVSAGGPAEKAGAQAGDFILEMGGRPLPSLEALLQAAQALRPGDKLQLTLEGTNGRRIITIIAGRRPDGLTQRQSE
jgi:serine protease Do